MFLRSIVACAALSLLIPGSARADFIDFESLIDLEQVTTQFLPDVAFSNATALTAGVSLVEAENPPRSGVNVVFDDGGPMSLLFMQPVFTLRGYFTYLAPLTLEAYDSSNALVASVQSLFTTNQALSGEPGSSPNELISMVVPGGFTSLVITGDPAGGSFVLDDLTFTAAVPEPATLSLLILGAAVVAARRRLIRHS